ncbi:hypothetical protein DPX16_16106 [Anabarilius grahami]|uniref:Uncharacterized protein n=1 Tax=Anabarilius grahami TaxID=495550 RepID=A0A3N0YNJ3_ANAGA|nr:hypothetical protein DPX16_16106 [Anabarilius grahami]
MEVIAMISTHMQSDIDGPRLSVPQVVGSVDRGGQTQSLGSSRGKTARSHHGPQGRIERVSGGWQHGDPTAETTCPFYFWLVAQGVTSRGLDPERPQSGSSAAPQPLEPEAYTLYCEKPWTPGSSPYVIRKEDMDVAQGVSPTCTMRASSVCFMWLPLPFPPWLSSDRGEGKGAAGAQLRITEILAQRALSSVICSQKGQSDPSNVASVWAWPRQKMHASWMSGTLLEQHPCSSFRITYGEQ